MTPTITYSIWNRSLSWAEALITIRQLVERRGFDPTGDFSVSIIHVSPIKSLVLNSLEESIQVLSKLQNVQSLKTVTKFLPATTKTKSPASNSLTIDISVYDVVSVEITSDDFDLVEGIHNEIKGDFLLNNPQLPTPDRPLYLQPTVFVGRHFDKAGNTAFDALETYLTLLALDVSQGAEYSSQDIPEKIIERINRQDIFLAIVTGNRDHAWLNAEPAYAKARGKHIILLVEEGAQYDPTILGRDLEQIRFPSGLIEKSFVPLLREFRNIRVKGLCGGLTIRSTCRAAVRAVGGG